MYMYIHEPKVYNKIRISNVYCTQVNTHTHIYIFYAATAVAVAAKYGNIILIIHHILCVHTVCNCNITLMVRSHM